MGDDEGEANWEVTEGNKGVGWVTEKEEVQGQGTWSVDLEAVSEGAEVISEDAPAEGKNEAEGYMVVGREVAARQGVEMAWGMVRRIQRPQDEGMGHSQPVYRRHNRDLRLHVGTYSGQRRRMFRRMGRNRLCFVALP